MKKTNNNQALVFENDLEILGYSEHLLGTMDGVEWAVRRHSMGHICGYVRVDSFPAIDYEMVISCHCGVTYEGDGLPGYPVDGYWIGFDCAHAGDWTPRYQHGVYRDFGYVMGQIRSVIKQLEEENHGKE